MKTINNQTNKKGHTPDYKKSSDVNFKDFCLSRNDLAVSQGFPYQWMDSHWLPLSEAGTRIGLERLSANYLEQCFPDKASTNLALSAAKFALFSLPELPARPDSHIIPLQDAWLIIGDDGAAIQAMPPNKNIGITYTIKAKLGQSSGIYQPTSLPEESLFSTFLKRSLPDMETRTLIQEFCGYTLLNGVQMQKAHIWHGAGANGKSVLLKVLSELHEKRAAIRLDKLDGFALSQLVGASLAIAPEAPRGSMNEEMLKAIITGDPITIEYKHKPEFTYSPSAKWIIACNEVPRIADKTDGVWRRFHIIDWTVQIPEEERIHNLDGLIIRNELKLVLDWCLVGAQRLIRRGKFNEPRLVQQASLLKRNENNNVAMFAEESNLSPSIDDAFLPKDELYAKYRDYCQESGYKSHSKDNFYKQLYPLFPGMNKDLKKSISGKWVRVVPLYFKAETAPATPQEINAAQACLDAKLDVFGW